MKHEKGYSENDVAKLVAHVMNKDMPKTRAWYRRNAIKNMTGAPKLDQPLDSHTKEVGYIAVTERACKVLGIFMGMRHKRNNLPLASLLHFDVVLKLRCKDLVTHKRKPLDVDLSRLAFYCINEFLHV